MKVEEMIAGNIYYLETAYKWIIRFDKIKGGTVFSIKGFINFGHSGTPTFDKSAYRNDGSIHKYIRPASEEETQWFIECEKAQNLVERPKIVNTYQIY